MQFVEKLQELKFTGDPVKFRFDEFASRPEISAQLSSVASQYRLLAQAPKEEYAHIADEKKRQIVDDCDAVCNWLNEKMAQQNALPKSAPLAVTVKELLEKQSALSKACDSILSEPKPAPPKPEPAAASQEPAPMDTDTPAEGEAPAEENAEDVPKDMDVD